MKVLFYNQTIQINNAFDESNGNICSSQDLFIFFYFLHHILNIHLETTNLTAFSVVTISLIIVA